MFWKIVRWGGTALVVLLVIAAVITQSPTDNVDGAVVVPEAGVDGTPVPASENKNFNL